MNIIRSQLGKEYGQRQEYRYTIGSLKVITFDKVTHDRIKNMTRQQLPFGGSFTWIFDE